jgi:hypothetical protein
MMFINYIDGEFIVSYNKPIYSAKFWFKIEISYDTAINHY